MNPHRLGEAAFEEEEGGARGRAQGGALKQADEVPSLQLF